MKVTFAKDQLVKAASITQSMVNPQTSLAVLANILIEAEDERVVFVTTDLEASVRCIVQAKVAEIGRTTVPARMFADLVRELPDGEVTLEIEGNLVKVHSEDNNYHLQTMPAEDFPSWPEIKPLSTLSIEQAQLAGMLGRILFAVPLRDPRKVLLGALFDVKEGALIAVATDGKKLGYSRRELTEVVGDRETSAIVPHKILIEVQRALMAEGEVKILIGDRQVAFDMGDVIFMANKIDGTYPNYQMVIPKEVAREVKFGKNEFAAAVRRASIISEEKNNSIVLRIEPERARITSRTYDVGDYEGRFPITYEGEAFDIAFNHKFLIEIMRIIQDNSVAMRVKTNIAPVIFVNETDEDSIYLIMPIKMSDLSDLGEGEE